MLFKIVLGEQIRVYDSKALPSLQELHCFIGKIFPKVTKYCLWYCDEDGDQISLDSEADLALYLEECKKPKIYMRQLPNESEIVGEQTQGAGSKISSGKVEIQKAILAQQVQGGKRQSDRIIIDEVKVAKDEGKEEIRPAEPKHEEPKKEEKREEKKEIKQEKDQVEVHHAKCDGCGVDPILNIRYKCGVCQDYDLCATCQETTAHNHPLIKIRRVSQTPIKVAFQFSHKLEEIKEKPQPKSAHIDPIVFQDEEERKQLIISYLSNLLGDYPEKQFESYRSFAEDSKSKDYDSLVEEYLLWQESKDGKKSGMLEWIKRKFAGMFAAYEEVPHVD